MLTVGWFSTGRGEGSLGLLRFIQERISLGDIDARIQFVFSNREPGEAEGSDRFFQQVRDYNIPLVNFSSQRFRRQRGGKFADHRPEYDREVMARIEEFTPDVCVLAGYMLIVGSEMCRRYTMLNLHPALPTGPAGTWQEVIWELIESRADRTGAMVHLATEELDNGPVIAYFTFPIVGGPFDEGWREIEGKPISQVRSDYGEELPLFRLIRQEGYKREPYLLAASLKALAKGDVRVSGGRALGAYGSPIQGLCLDGEIEAALASG
jgi:folate-dependent phosphoribosylglycinamide formyltransferase PurN